VSALLTAGLVILKLFSAWSRRVQNYFLEEYLLLR
jgi:hypothetical protein